MKFVGVLHIIQDNTMPSFETTTRASVALDLTEQQLAVPSNISAKLHNPAKPLQLKSCIGSHKHRRAGSRLQSMMTMSTMCLARYIISAVTPQMTRLILDLQGMDHHQGQLQQLLRKHARQNLKLPRRRQLDLANTRCRLGGLVARDDCNVLLSGGC